MGWSGGPRSHHWTTYQYMPCCSSVMLLLYNSLYNTDKVPPAIPIANYLLYHSQSLGIHFLWLQQQVLGLVTWAGCRLEAELGERSQLTSRQRAHPADDVHTSELLTRLPSALEDLHIKQQTIKKHVEKLACLFTVKNLGRHYLHQIYDFEGSYVLVTVCLSVCLFVCL